MDNVSISTNSKGELFFNDMPIGFYVEKSDSPNTWYLQRYGWSHKQFATFKRKGDVLTAVQVFVEGATKQDNESVFEAVVRATQSCLETGSTSIVVLRK